jgi:hypothetical protein
MANIAALITTLTAAAHPSAVNRPGRKQPKRQRPTHNFSVIRAAVRTPATTIGRSRLLQAAAMPRRSSMLTFAVFHMATTGPQRRPRRRPARRDTEQLQSDAERRDVHGGEDPRPDIGGHDSEGREGQRDERRVGEGAAGDEVLTCPSYRLMPFSSRSAAGR